MAWFRKEKKPRELSPEKQTAIPEGLWVKCDDCKEIVYRKEVEANLNVCPKCGYHFRISARERFEILFDDGKYKEFASDIRSGDPLEFRDTKRYRDRLKVYENRVGKGDAVLCAEGKLEGMPVVVCAMEYNFMGGSMGSVVGEKITIAAERALDKKEPFIIVSCSGGARMQEGILSLMQMAKISAALARLAEAGLPYISILTDPTTGGVTASYAMLGDLNIAEPKALIGFAGPRVIEQTIRQTLPEGFQRAEFLVEHGMVDLISPRSEMKPALGRFLRIFSGK
ncbi:MAG TPA: acetyl-CoA carboxylase, carboxyltransferase subunit beta [Thermoanaerobaculia bacterium]|jgi:acetyl-CoA carboxylase carboxyl transferase subunit beta|nr:acetyl-CoA carboxylase, carboxyltransferase subunit beta [Thermoanaerobaculia bacterium]